MSGFGTFTSRKGTSSAARARAARGNVIDAFLDAVQNALAAPHDRPIIEFGLLCRVAEELAEKSGVMGGDPRDLSPQQQKAYGQLRKVYQETITLFDGRDGLREDLRTLCWAALADTGDAEQVAEELGEAAQDARFKADPNTKKNASDWIGQPLSDFIDDCLLVSNHLEDWERVLRRQPRRAEVLAQIRGGYVPPRLRESQPPSPKPDDEQELSEHPEIG